MGRRSRKRADGRSAAPPVESGASAAPTPAAAQGRAAGPPGRVDRMIARADERPKAPWHPFPLVELCVLLGIGMIIYGFFNTDSQRGRVALVCGLALASLAGLDTAIRDHFGGFRSHSTLLAGVPAIVTAAVLYFAGAPWIAVVLVGAAVFGAALLGFRRAFRSRTGVAFRA